MKLEVVGCFNGHIDDIRIYNRALKFISECFCIPALNNWRSRDPSAQQLALTGICRRKLSDAINLWFDNQRPMPMLPVRPHTRLECVGSDGYVECLSASVII